MPELLIVGGLTVDRFADGRRAPGGSVLHAGLAAHAEGATITTLTVAGDEPEAREGLDRLARLGRLIHQPSGSTTAFRHEEADGRRVLVYETAGTTVDPAPVDRLEPPDVALLAPIADELPGPVLVRLRERLRPRLTVLLIQGWLRRLEVGAAIRPVALDEVDPALWQAFGRADALVVSTEDLAEAPTDPFAQAARLRARIGPLPLLVVTLGDRGYLLDDPAADRVSASIPRRVVPGVPAVGAGDTFGAALAVALARDADPATASATAAERVIHVLEGRRR
jgi:sugar/nucleoside kinase (ribokinase family)